MLLVLLNLLLLQMLKACVAVTFVHAQMTLIELLMHQVGDDFYGLLLLLLYVEIGLL